jgi:hypothetical protein
VDDVGVGAASEATEGEERAISRPPSSRPTSRPTVGPDDLLVMPGDAVPRALERHPKDAALGVREAFVFFHIDGRASLDAIAELSGLGVGDVKQACALLRAVGLIDVDGARVPRAPGSDERPTVTPPPPAAT